MRYDSDHGSFVRAGIPVLLLSASGEKMIERIARDLDVEYCIGNRLEFEDEVCTGRLHKPYVYGAGKLVLLEGFIAERGIDLAGCAAFADSQSDLPLLEAVGFPHAVNPDRRLRKVVQQRGWPVVRFRRTGEVIATG